MKLIRTITLCCITWMPCLSQQTDLLDEIVSRLADPEHAAAFEQTHEMISALIQNPLEINNCNERQLEESGLFTPFQVFGIMKYKNKYGPFFSVYEMAAIPGFSQEWLRLIHPLLLFEPPKTPSDRMHAGGRSITNLSGRRPRSEAYENEHDEPVYAGKPFRMTSRFRYDYGANWSAGIAYDKDPGEKIMNQKYPEHLAGYLMVTPQKMVSRIILGNFRIHRGMGIVHGTGFTAGNISPQLNGYRRSFAKAFASTMEYNYYRGIYLSADPGKWNTDLFCSFRPVDLSLFRLKERRDLFDRLSGTGLHRTQKERNSYRLGTQGTLGWALNRSSDQGFLGASVTRAVTKLTTAGRDSVDRTTPGMVFDTVRTNLSVYGAGYRENREIYAEIAMDRFFRTALTAGFNVVINPALTTFFSFRRYQPGFTGQTPSAEGTGNDPENVLGLVIGSQLSPFRKARLFILSDLSRQIEVSGPGDTPGWSVRNTLRMTYNPADRLLVKFKYSGRTKKILITGSGWKPADVKYSTSKQDRYRIGCTADLHENLTISGSTEYALLQAGTDKHTGHMSYIQTKITPSANISIVYRFLLFNSEQWENRIYTYEPGVRYSFSFPAWHGRGTRNVAVISWKLRHWSTLRFKTGATTYAHHRNTGSGHDTREGNHLLDWELQWQVNL